MTLRGAVVGLICFAAGAEEVLLAELAGRDGPDGPHCWGALPTVAHNCEFKDQQVQRLVSVRHGGTPPDFAGIDHRSAATYRRYRARPLEAVRADNRRTTGRLIDGLLAASDADLSDPSRHPWLNGRLLWLQIVVRGFWHPTGHLGGYYLVHHGPERAVALHTDAVATARSLGAPGPALGMACYSLACAQARAGRPDPAMAALAEAVSLNPDLEQHAARDPDLDSLRIDGRLELPPAAEVSTSP